jgi:demethylmenaquinone methyltransferase/2-methoxy-6-polyprenyl-1,4-benzoquinol methylase
MAGSVSILAEQLAYYRAAASEYEYQGVDFGIDLVGLDELLTAIDAFRPTGDVLELACGTGVWTQHLVRFARTVTAVDGAPEMLARAQARDGNESVRFIEADLFAWRSDRRYDAVFFGFWLSHVPEEHFDSFWSLVDDCLRPGGQVFFCDDNYRAEAELIEGRSSPIVQRRTGDARHSASSRSPSNRRNSKADYARWDGISRCFRPPGRSTGARADGDATRAVWPSAARARTAGPCLNPDTQVRPSIDAGFDGVLALLHPTSRAGPLSRWARSSEAGLGEQPWRNCRGGRFAGWTAVMVASRSSPRVGVRLVNRAVAAKQSFGIAVASVG